MNLKQLDNFFRWCFQLFVYPLLWPIWRSRAVSRQSVHRLGALRPRRVPAIHSCCPASVRPRTHPSSHPIESWTGQQTGAQSITTHQSPRDACVPRCHGRPHLPAAVHGRPTPYTSPCHGGIGAPRQAGGDETRSGQVTTSWLSLATPPGEEKLGRCCDLLPVVLPVVRYSGSYPFISYLHEPSSCPANLLS